MTPGDYEADTIGVGSEVVASIREDYRDRYGSGRRVVQVQGVITEIRERPGLGITQVVIEVEHGGGGKTFHISIPEWCRTTDVPSRPCIIARNGGRDHVDNKA